ncbi:MAG TPA: Fe-S cluster assembly protein SufD [Terriglobales bacterium]|nr:Fe-S cluster assembly protein SufD [Terriglobales bacterium]
MSNVITTTPQLASYLDAFSAFNKRAPGHTQPWLRSLREDAFSRFAEVGFPTTHDEDWRFTSVAAIANTAFQLPAAGKAKVSAHELEPYRFTASACQLVFVNGRYAPELSVLGVLPKGVKVGSLAEQITNNASAIEPHLGRYLNTQRDAFCALNTAFIEDGAYLHIARGAVLENPIYLLFVSVGSDTPLMTHPRNLIIAEENSQAAIIEDYISLGSGEPAFSNTATELVAGDDSVVSHYMLEREHAQAFNISTLRIQQGRSTSVASHSVLLGGRLVRNNVHPVLAGEGADCLINGLFIGNGRQHMDNYMLVEHASPHCGSRQFYNGILDGHSRGVFHGRIIVHKDAQKTDAKQTNRNLLLSDNAQIDTKPQLEIYADDVKCTHGATIGQIEENALFYLRSRGMDEGSARRLLLYAFASECLDRMKPEALRAHLEQLITGWLFGEGGFASEITAAHALEAASGQPTQRKPGNWEEVG